MSLSKGTPLSSQIVWLERRLHQLENANYVLVKAMTQMGIDFISDEERIRIALGALVESHRLQAGSCRKCGGLMEPSKAIGQTYTGTPDFPGGEVVTMSPGGPGKLMDCWKCVSCGWSIT